MKKLLAVTAVASLAFFSAASALASEAKTTVKIAGWHCAGCAEETAEAIKKVKGVKSVDADFDKNEVVVAYDDSKVKPADFEKAVKKSGYNVAKQ